jgi:hypothetical protein
MERRTLLVLAGSISTSGCLGAIGGPKKRIGWIRLVNNRSEAHHVDVVIERDGEETFTDSYRLGTDPESSGARIDAPLEERGSYVLRFRAEGQWSHIDPSEYDDVRTNCIGVRFELHGQGTQGYEIEPTREC